MRADDALAKLPLNCVLGGSEGAELALWSPHEPVLDSANAISLDYQQGPVTV